MVISSTKLPWNKPIYQIISIWMVSHKLVRNFVINLLALFSSSCSFKVRSLMMSFDAIPSRSLKNWWRRSTSISCPLTSAPSLMTSTPTSTSICSNIAPSQSTPSFASARWSPSKTSTLLLSTTKGRSRVTLTPGSFQWVLIMNSATCYQGVPHLKYLFTWWSTTTTLSSTHTMST